MDPLLCSSSWAPVVQTALGTFIGAAGAIAGGAFGPWFTWQKVRQAIAAALAGEVEAVKSIAEFRQYRQIIERCTELTKANNKLVYFTFSIEDHPFLVFEENVSKIGFLPDDLVRQVTQYYSYARSAVQDFRTLYSQNLYNWPLPAAVVPALVTSCSTMKHPASIRRTVRRCPTLPVSVGTALSQHVDELRSNRSG
jgi:hypothetical protein